MLWCVDNVFFVVVKTRPSVGWLSQKTASFRGLFCGLELPQYLFCEATKTVRDRDQNLAGGKLYLHNEESSALFPKLGEKELHVDVVVVYKSRTYAKTKTGARKNMIRQSQSKMYTLFYGLSEKRVSCIFWRVVKCMQMSGTCWHRRRSL